MRARLLAATALVLLAAPVAAQRDGDLDGRVGKLEGEMRAVQRKVFPGGAGQYLEPEVQAQRPAEEPNGAPAASAVADLTARVASLEGQMASLTGQVEQASHRAREAEDALDAYRRATDARLRALETAAPPAAAAIAPGGTTAVDEPAPPPIAPARPGPRTRAAGATPARPTPAAADPARDAKVAAIARPSTGDPAEDAYLYGYRLWQAKLYPEAQAALKQATADYPKSRRYSYSQNLLGRAYLDDGKPSLASMAFYDNYKKMPDGDRAPESLYYLAQALTKLNKLPEACKVYDELSDVYPTKLTTRMKADVAAGRDTAKCK
jgi:TolA-binding protein